MNPNCIERRDSTVAPQALHLMNNAHGRRNSAGDFARRVRREAGDDPAGRSTRSTWIALSRPPTPRRRSSAVRRWTPFADEWEKQLGGGREARPRRGRVEGAGDLLSRDHELGGFLYVD